MTPTIAKLALDWVAAERADAARRGVTMDPIPKEDELAVAADRVYLVMAGEIPWSQCGPGDRAIWRGRFRDIQLFEQLWNDDDRQWLRREAEADGPRRGRTPRRVGGTTAGAGAVRPNYPSPQYPGGPPAPATPIGLGGAFAVSATAVPGGVFAGDQALGARARGRGRQIICQDEIWYDTITANELEDVNPSRRLFGRSHIGMPHLCNLKLAGQPVLLGVGYILGIWIWPTTSEGLLYIANRWRFTVEIQGKPSFGPIHARDLFQGYVFQRPLEIAERQNFSVIISGEPAVPAAPEGANWDVSFCVQAVVKREM